VTTVVRFERHDLRAVRLARRALALISDYVDEAGGIRGRDVALALDDLELLADRMQAELGDTADVIPLDTFSRRA